MAVADTPGTRAWKSASMRGQSTTVRARPGRRTGACFTSASRSVCGLCAVVRMSARPQRIGRAHS